MFVASVARFAARHRLWQPHTRIVAAVSGGSDSVAMLLILHALAQRGQLVLSGVAHLHHGIRGAAADDDQAFCRELSEALGLFFYTRVVDVPAEAAARRRSIEVTARELRRAFLDKAVHACEADVAATAHTADDQAETVLMRVFRGTGLRGLGGIAPAAPGRVRPVLGCSRALLQAELERRGQPWREDASNRDLAQARNRLRHEAIPYLERHFNPRARQALCRLADRARADDAALTARLVRPDGIVTASEGRLVIDRQRWLDLPPAVAGRALVAGLEALGGPAPTAAAVDMIRAVASGEQRAAQIPARRVEPSGPSVVLVHSSAPSARPAWQQTLDVPGRVVAAPLGWSIEAEGPKPFHTATDQWGGSSDEVWIDASAAGTVLLVRNRRPGDWVRPLGLGGRKKVQDVLVDRKVPRHERDSVPVVSHVDGRLVWVAGHVLDERFRLTERTNAVIILKLRRI